MTSVIIIGGGITALSTAWFLVKTGIPVRLFYKKRLGMATQAAGGMLSPSCEADGCSEALITLGVRSSQMYPEWIRDIEECSGIPCHYRATGTLLVAMHHDQYRDLEHLATFQLRHGLKAQELSKREVRMREPNLTRQVGGLFCPDDHSINPRSLYHSLYQALLNKGALIEEAAEIQVVSDEQEIVHLLVDGIQYQAEHYVLSDGAWTQALFPLPLRPVKGQFIRLEGTDILESVIRTPTVYCVPRAGELFLGATMEEEGFNKRNTAGPIMDLLYHTFQILPAVYELPVLEFGSGFRPALRDNQPLIGSSPLNNCWFNTAHYRHGILIAPAAAQLFSTILQGEKESFDFSFQRFQDISMQ